LDLLTLLAVRVYLNDLVVVVRRGDGTVTRLATAVMGLLTDGVIERVGDTSLRLRRELGRGK
jgi:hypothetical protein